MPQQLLDPWKSFFTDIDTALNQEVSFHCIGGFAAKMLYDLPRETSDVDVLPVASNKEIDSVIRSAIAGSPLHKKYGIYLQVRSNTFVCRVWTLTILPSRKSNETVNAIAMM